jgi:MoxR-like ATPase
MTNTKPMIFTQKQKAFVTAARAKVGLTTELILTTAEVLAIAEKAGLKKPQWMTADPAFSAGRGLYRVPTMTQAQADEPAAEVAVAAPAAPAPAAPKKVAVAAVVAEDHALAFHSGNLVPEIMKSYVPFGCHKDIKLVVSKRVFFPVYVTGLSGNGKTTTFEQVCAELGREFFRVNITPETCEDDLLGGFRLLNGETVWVDGPVVVAMKRGAFLLLDEIDLGTTKVMCLQPVLEGKAVFLKKTNTWVYPAKGFTIGLTGNTKGRGDETGKFVGTNVMNEAFLDRVPLTVEQEYPKPEVETKIVMKIMEMTGEVDQQFAEVLVKWADQIRRSYAEGACEDVITTRRLIQAAQGYAIFGNRKKAVEGILTRFDALTQAAFLDLYKKLDVVADGGENTENLGAAPAGATAPAAPAPAAAGNACPF